MPIYPDNPFFGGNAPKQLRRGTSAEVANYVPAVAELVLSTSTNELFVGDGTTVGGIPITGGASSYDFGAI